MSHRIVEAGGVFSEFHAPLVGEPVDFSGFDYTRFDPALLEEARGTWMHRVHTEFRSTQVMNRFLGEVLGAGDPIDVYAGALDLVEDEIKHTALCMQVCRALGFEPRFPDPPHIEYPDEYLRAPMGERALATAISMVTINETLSVGFVTDLAERCEEPGISDVLRMTIEDEEGHQEFGWSYISHSLERFPKSTLTYWRGVVEQTLESHLSYFQPILDSLEDWQRTLDVWPDHDRIPLGLFCRERQALVFEQTYNNVLAPRLRELKLLD
jgi:hypothetical protein